MEIIFLGSGGGRVNLVNQQRGTGGFRIMTKTANIHVDPGPGALLKSIERKLDPKQIDIIIISHKHIDHFSDAMVLIEAMAQKTWKRRGILIGSRQAIEGDEYRDRAVQIYHQNKLEHVIVGNPGEKKSIKTENGSFEIEFFAHKHEEPSTIGFKMKIDGHAIGYISDTEYREQYGSEYRNCDVLIVNCLKPKNDGHDGHLTTENVIDIVKKAKPKRCILTHLGMKMQSSKPEKEAQKIEDETGVKTIAATDQLKVTV
ncbi:MBL fold metallo-hydrolase [Candidatus Micrarchaeota archaeon]|nr:MBL fold metallo-hydrolase [Candidatus Micrarchaeota archaeon]